MLIFQVSLVGCDIFEKVIQKPNIRRVKVYRAYRVHSLEIIDYFCLSARNFFVIPSFRFDRSDLWYQILMVSSECNSIRLSKDWVVPWSIDNIIDQKIRLWICAMHVLNERSHLLESISKISFGPISALGARFNSSKYISMSAGWILHPPWPWPKILFLRWIHGKLPSACDCILEWAKCVPNLNQNIYALILGS